MKFDEVLFHSRITHENGHTICGLAWNPKGNKEIAYTDNQVSKNVIINAPKYCAIICVILLTYNVSVKRQRPVTYTCEERAQASEICPV